MPSTLIPAPELEPSSATHLRAQARRHAGAPAGSPVTLDTPLTTTHVARDRGRIEAVSYSSGWNWLLQERTVPEEWSLYGIADLSPNDDLVTLRLRLFDPHVVDTPQLRIEEVDMTVLHLSALEQDSARSQRLGYLVPPLWLAPGSTLAIEMFTAPERPVGPSGPACRTAISLLGYYGPA